MTQYTVLGGGDAVCFPTIAKTSGDSKDENQTMCHKGIPSYGICLALNVTVGILMINLKGSFDYVIINVLKVFF